MIETFFTADTHFGHRNVIAYCNRPYEDVEEMNEDLIKRWNETVGPHDMVFHLGDFAFQNKERTRDTIQRLNGFKILIKGNHDNRTVSYYLEAGFREVHKLPYGASAPFWIWDNHGTSRVGFEMSHFPFADVMGDYDERDYLVERAPARERLKNTVLVHGHVHEKWATRPNLVNVGVDVHDLRPIPLGKVLELVDSVRETPD
jgi:calcineurin-like phosphoesterase family protein